MSKKVTSIWVLMATALLSFPTSQAQVQKKAARPAASATEMRTLPAGQKLNAAELKASMQQVEAMQAKAEAAKAEAAKSAPKTSVANLFGALNSTRQAMSLSDLAVRDYTNFIQRAAGIDAHGIITTPDEGEHKYYTREGWAYFLSGGSVYYGEQSGVAEIVETEDGSIYMKNPVSQYTQGSWVKGTKEGNTISFAAGQPLAYNTSYMTTLSMYKSVIDASGNVNKESGDITFTIDGDVITLNDTDEDHPISIFWDDDDSWTGYGDYETVLTLDPTYEPPSTTLVELPEGATVEEWFITGESNGGIFPTKAKVAIVGNEIYLSSLFADFPAPWIVGTLEGTTVTFPTLQYLGYDASYGVDFYLYTVNLNEAAGTYIATDAATFTYDAEAQTLTLDPENCLVLNAATDRMYYLDYITELTLSAKEPVIEPNTVPFVANFALASTFKKFVVIDNNHDGNTWTYYSPYARYTYSYAYNADDYLVVPIELEAGKNYNVTVNAAAYSAYYPEKFEVKAGKSATAEGLNITAIPEVTLNTADFADYEGSFTTNETGTWYVAIHATSDADQFYLHVSSLSIELGADPNAPAAPAVTAAAFPMGILGAMVSVQAPASAVDGSTLADNVTKIDVLRDGEVVKTYEDVVPGGIVYFSDENLSNGMHTYQAIPYNEYGIGLKSTAVNIWIGVDEPTDVENVQIAGTTESTVSLTWDAIEGVHDAYINPADVKYSVTTIEFYDFLGFQIPVEGETLGTVTGVTAATVDYPMDEGTPNFGYFGVKATSGGASSDPTSWMAYALVGAPYELPILESFTGQALHYVWDYNENTGLGVTNDSFDEDGMALALRTVDEDGFATFETFKLNVKDAPNAAVTFAAKKGTSATDQITVYSILPDGTTADIETVTLTDEYQIFKVKVPENVKNDRWVRLGFKAELEAGTYVQIDDIKILDLYQNDLSIAVKAPTSIIAGSTATITATVKNEGEQDATGYTVVIKAGDKELASIAAEETLAMFETFDYEAEFATSVFDDAADVVLTATVIYEADEKTENNAAETAIAVKEPTVAGVTDLAAEDTADGLQLSWTAPDVTAVEEVTEDFEDGEGGWTFIDADGDGFNWYYHFNTHETGTDNTTHSGDGSVASASYDNATYTALTPDNWLVSPAAKLTGTFSFWAVGQDADYAYEHFQVWASTESPEDISTFAPVSEEFIATGVYQEYTADLSAFAGADGWIAIRHFNVTDQFVLVVDDITYSVGPAAIDHYNVYVDGELALTVAADQLGAVVEVLAGQHTVAVSVVYVTGQESKPAVVTIGGATAIEELASGSTKAGIVYDLYGRRVNSIEAGKAYIQNGNTIIRK